MRYGELFQFDPIETVIQLREADLADEARRLIRTYVISDRMAEQIIDVVLPHLRFDAPHELRRAPRLVVHRQGADADIVMLSRSSRELSPVRGQACLF